MSKEITNLPAALSEMPPQNCTKSSLSENNGIRFLSKGDRKIYSVGISTGGLAEIKMAKADINRKIIATTIDAKGAKYAKERIVESGLSDRIEVKIEDVSEPLPYPDYQFDYIYARLVLHYLPKNTLTSSLGELYRILRKGGRIFVVVRSIDCKEANDSRASFDPLTGMTSYSSNGQSYSRYFHSQESIRNHLASIGFTIQHIDAYPEQLCVDFQRQEPSSQIDHLIEILGEKP